MEERFVRAVSDFFASEEWWKPVCGFMATNCAIFEGETNSVEQYQNFMQFQGLVGELVDSFLCRKLDIRPFAFEQTMIQLYDAGQYQIRAIVGIIKNLSDFAGFKRDMQLTSKRIEEDVTNIMEEFRNKSNEIQENETVDAVSMLEKSEEISLQKQAEIKCKETKEKLKLTEMNFSKSLPAKFNFQQQQQQPIVNNAGLQPLGPLIQLPPHVGSLQNQTRGSGLLSNTSPMRQSQGSGMSKPLIMKPGFNKARASKRGSLK